MTGEMDQNDLKDWPIHQAVAEALGGRLQPFDVYAGPYIDWMDQRLFIHHPEKMWRALILG